jgi:hypothetical protein
MPSRSNFQGVSLGGDSLALGAGGGVGVYLSYFHFSFALFFHGMGGKREPGMLTTLVE